MGRSPISFKPPPPFDFRGKRVIWVHDPDTIGELLPPEILAYNLKAGVAHSVRIDGGPVTLEDDPGYFIHFDPDKDTGTQSPIVQVGSNEVFLEPFLPIDDEADSDFSEFMCNNFDTPAWRDRPQPSGLHKVQIQSMSPEEWAERFWEACDQGWDREQQYLIDGKGIPESYQSDALGLEGAVFAMWAIFNLAPGPSQPYEAYKEQYTADVIAMLKHLGL